MEQIIYVDILFIVNFLITYLLLLTTMKLMKSDEKRWRMLIGAFFGGIYSLIILAPDLNYNLSLISKFLSAGLIILISFKRSNWKRYLKAVSFFFGASFVFVGVMIALWFTFKPNGLIINNSTVYFDIDSKILIISALIAYILANIIIKIHNKTAAKNQIYNVVVHSNGKEKSFNAFADTGNKLKEPFSNTPVVVVNESLMNGMFNSEKMRVIPFHTISTSGVMQSFKPEFITINDKKITNVYIALSDGNFKNGDFEGVINPDLLNI